MDSTTRYLQIVDWAQRRYSFNGQLIRPLVSNYYRVESLAWRRYMQNSH